MLPICALAWFKAIVELNSKSSNLWQPSAKDLPRTVNDHGAAQKFPRHSSQLFCGCRKAHIGSGSAQKVRRRSLSPKDETVSKRRLILQPVRHFSNCNTLTEKPVVISPALMDEPTVTVGTSRNKTEQPYHWSRSPWLFQSKRYELSSGNLCRFREKQSTIFTASRQKSICLKWEMDTSLPW